jgi:hypothetical protein
MGKLAGPLKFTGKLGDLSLYKGKNGDIIIKQSSAPSKKKVKKDRVYENFRRTGTEFGRASKAAAQIRHAVNMHYRSCSDTGVDGRLNKAVLEVLKTDPIHNWGGRIVSAGKVEKLEGFQWHEQQTLDNVLLADTAGFIEFGTGVMHAVVSSFDCKTELINPEYATDFEIIAGAVGINPEGNDYTHDTKRSGKIAINKGKVKGFVLDLKLEPEGLGFMLLTLGIVFYQTVAGVSHQMKSKGAMEVLKAGKPQ